MSFQCVWCGTPTASVTMLGREGICSREPHGPSDTCDAVLAFRKCSGRTIAEIAEARKWTVERAASAVRILSERGIICEKEDGWHIISGEPGEVN